ncbi:cytochrome P450 9e2 [Tribolium castaneum]|uniref:Cytochrome P450 9Z6 n=1 Tax=Tribolium castaneum TaxID=7070 RepID=D6WWW1_TRICA|nr:PREDICTED: cytochrome P450 9e2 [Tribolium castaneum]XP_015838027.1 PREDICTED: cytochrome P450 9e2 [Tribolium castaneum]EFA09275.1 cytochrome P450 9Z6 [Tribolium castaneum]|eukprot:XP_015838026.1 PREDICTED: cytochrome P450 9e2 [Tribolium castaneum]
MFWILVGLALVALYWALSRPHSYWKRKGVVQGSPVFLLGDSWPMLFRKYSPPEMTELFYKASPNTRYFGIYEFLTPGLLLRDPDLIKQITVKDFDHFVDRRPFVPEKADPLFGKSLFSLKGPKWRAMRSTLSPVFTSSKMKYMFQLMSQTGERFINHFLNQKEEVVTVEMKEITTKFANDVIGNIVFGYECDSVKDPKNEFYVMGADLTNFRSLRFLLVFSANMIVPKLLALFKIPLFPKKVSDFFVRVVNDNIESREKHGIVRPDMIHLLLKMKSNNLKHEEVETVPDAGFASVEESELGKNAKTVTKITNEDIAAQALLFFFAGFDSVSSLISYMAYELAVNPDVQTKLLQEVDETRQKSDGKITYEALMSMKYMDMVVSEALRKWPNAIATERVCTKPYTIEPKLPDEKPLRLEIGDVVAIPMYAIQRDPKYFPEPERFIPERFSDENKSKVQPYTFMSFGTGPRSCIGSRFALLETKLLFYYFLTNFEFVPVEKTQIPIKFNRKALNMSPENGFWLGLKRRV